MMASFMSAFSPELHAVDVVTRVVESVKVALSARDAFVFVVDRCERACMRACVRVWSRLCLLFAAGVVWVPLLLRDVCGL